MPWTQEQRARQYSYYHGRAIDLLREMEEPQPQRVDLERIIQVATCLKRACPFSVLKHFYQTIITQATGVVNRTVGEQGES